MPPSLSAQVLWKSNTMSITARLHENGEELASDDNRIYAVSDGGTRGTCQYTGSRCHIAVYGNSGEDISFMAETEDGSEVVLANETLQFAGDAVGGRKTPSAIATGEATGMADIGNGQDGTVSVHAIGGRPISRNTTLRTLRQLPAGICMVNGRKRVVTSGSAPSRRACGR